MIPDAGHMALFERPAAVNAALKEWALRWGAADAAAKKPIAGRISTCPSRAWMPAAIATPHSRPGGLDHNETADHFGGLKERTIADDRLAVTHRNRSSCRRRVERIGRRSLSACCEGRRMRTDVSASTAWAPVLR